MSTNPLYPRDTVGRVAALAARRINAVLEYLTRRLDGVNWCQWLGRCVVDAVLLTDGQPNGYCDVTDEQDVPHYHTGYGDPAKPPVVGGWYHLYQPRIGTAHIKTASGSKWLYWLLWDRGQAVASLFRTAWPLADKPQVALIRQFEAVSTNSTPDGVGRLVFLGIDGLGNACIWGSARSTGQVLGDPNGTANWLRVYEKYGRGPAIQNDLPLTYLKFSPIYHGPPETVLVGFLDNLSMGTAPGQAGIFVGTTGRWVENGFPPQLQPFVEFFDVVYQATTQYLTSFNYGATWELQFEDLFEHHQWDIIPNTNAPLYGDYMQKFHDPQGLLAVQAANVAEAGVSGGGKPDEPRFVVIADDWHGPYSRTVSYDSLFGNGRTGIIFNQNQQIFSLPNELSREWVAGGLNDNVFRLIRDATPQSGIFRPGSLYVTRSITGPGGFWRVLPGVPQVYAQDREALHLIGRLIDQSTFVASPLVYSYDAGSTWIELIDDQKVILEPLMPDDNIAFCGGWIVEAP